MKKHSLPALLTAALLLAGTASALAAEPEPADTVPIPAGFADVGLASGVVDDAELADMRGGFMNNNTLFNTLLFTPLRTILLSSEFKSFLVGEFSRLVPCNAEC